MSGCSIWPDLVHGACARLGLVQAGLVLGAPALSLDRVLDGWVQSEGLSRSGPIALDQKGATRGT